MIAKKITGNTAPEVSAPKRFVGTILRIVSMISGATNFTRHLGASGQVKAYPRLRNVGDNKRHHHRARRG